jgi:hypothetical protein
MLDGRTKSHSLGNIPHDGNPHATDRATTIAFVLVFVSRSFGLVFRAQSGERLAGGKLSTGGFLKGNLRTVFRDDRRQGPTHADNNDSRRSYPSVISDRDDRKHEFRTPRMRIFVQQNRFLSHEHSQERFDFSIFPAVHSPADQGFRIDTERPISQGSAHPSFFAIRFATKGVFRR